MNLKETVKTQLVKTGCTATGLLDSPIHETKIRDCMRITADTQLHAFYLCHSKEITAHCNDDPELLTDNSITAGTLLALENTLMLIEAGR
jgi:hypothetical protein